MATATGQAAGLCTALAAHIGSEREVAAAGVQRELMTQGASPRATEDSTADALRGLG
ncbi:MAG: hypothetical protein QOH27_3146 [Mycobacterium sp.]|jgi:hypothetical protein|nr:hypothetical protein [Mycobacterium sp.]